MKPQVNTATGLALGLSALLLAGTAPEIARAQTMDANASSFNAGYGRYAGQDNRAIDTYTRDANGNRLVVDGIIQTGEANSSYSRRGGAQDSVSGAGVLGGSTAIGNSLNVVVQGNHNTVVVNSRQVNNGDVIAGVTNQTPSPAGYAAAAARARADASAAVSTRAGTSGLSTLDGLNGGAGDGVSGAGATTLNGEINLDDAGL